MTDLELENHFSKLVRTERKIMHEVLKALIKIEDRRIYIKPKSTSLIQYLMDYQGYSKGCAYQRVEASKLLRAVPEVAEKIQESKITLTTLAKTQRMMSAQEKVQKRKFTPSEKAKVVEQVEGKTTDQADQVLFELFPDAATKEKESVKRVSATNHRITFELTDDQMKALERARELKPNLSQAEMFMFLADYFLKNEDPLQQPPQTEPKPGATVNTRMERFVRQRDNDSCQYPISKNEICGSRQYIEIDHIKPLALGGKHEAHNLRCLCRRHNQLHSERALGYAKANAWRKV